MAQRVLNRGGNGALLHGDLLQMGGEGGVAAVVAPVSIDDAQLRNSRVAVLLVAEIVAAEEERSSRLMAKPMRP